jgi:hypothetical protein
MRFGPRWERACFRSHRFRRTQASRPHHGAAESRLKSFGGIRAILDLVLLGLAQRLHLLEVYNNKHGKYSGFSVLAYNLWSSKIVLKHLIEDSGVHFGLD